MTFDPNLVASVGNARAINAVLTCSILVGLAAWCARVAPSPTLRKWCWSLPLIRAGAELMGKLPRNAYISSDFTAQLWDLHWHFGVVFREPFVVPSFMGRLGVLEQGQWSTLSPGGLLVNALASRGLSWFLIAAFLLLVSVATLRVTFRLRHWLLFSLEEERARQNARSLGEWRVQGRLVPVLVATNGRGTYVSGVLHPVIWLSPEIELASEAQRRAVIEHELCHVRQLDVLLFALLRLVRDALWFVPGLALIERRIRLQAEFAADSAALRRGCSASDLAVALAIQGEANLSEAQAPLAGQTALERVRRLTSGEASSVEGTRLRMFAATYLFGAGLLSSFFGS